MSSIRVLDKRFLLNIRTVYKLFRSRSSPLKSIYHTYNPTKTCPKFITTVANNCFSDQDTAPEEECEAKPKKTFYADTENQFAFSVLDSLLSETKFSLSDTPLDNPSKLDDGLNCDLILEKFLQIDPKEFENSKYDILDLIGVLKFLSLKQISLVLQSLTHWSSTSPFYKLFYQIWSKIDQELERRLKNIKFTDSKQILEYFYIGNQFYKLRIANISKFNECLIKKLCSPDLELDKLSLLHLMFYANLQRSLDPKVVPFVMKQVSKLLNELSLDETAVITMSAFKTRTIWSEDLIKQLIKKACADVTIETKNLVRTEITKCIRKSAGNYYYKIQPEVRQFVETMKRLPDNATITLTHLLNLMTSTHVYDSDLISTAINRVDDDLTAFRIKDIERVFMCLSFFNCDHHLDKLESISDKLNSNKKTLNIYNYPNCLLNVLHYLCVLKCYPKPLIENCFDPPFLTKIQKYSKLDFQRHLLLTNTALSVEKYDEFKDILLSPELVHRYHRWILSEEKVYNRISRKHQIINSVYMTLVSMLQKRVQLCHVIPSKSHPFIVIFDDPKKTFSFGPTTQLKPNMFSGSIVVFVVELNDYAIEDNMLKGSVNLEIRLLEGMGFKVVTIPWHRFMRFNTSKGRRNAITNHISTVLPDFKFHVL